MIAPRHAGEELGLTPGHKKSQQHMEVKNVRELPLLMKVATCKNAPWIVNGPTGESESAPKHAEMV